MSRPDKITIGGMVFAVTWRKKIKSRLHGVKRQLYGLIDHDTCEIQVATAYNEQHQQVTLLHEVMHGVLAQARVALDDDTEERVLDALDVGIWRLLRDNPQMTDWLRK